MCLQCSVCTLHLSCTTLGAPDTQFALEKACKDLLRCGGVPGPKKSLNMTLVKLAAVCYLLLVLLLFLLLVLLVLLLLVLLTGHNTAEWAGRVRHLSTCKHTVL